MTEQEYIAIRERLSKYGKLCKARDELYKAREVITRPWTETGPCGQGPFTGNTRESRRIDSMSIKFTATRGGSPPVGEDIFNLHIEAWDFAKAVVGLIDDKLNEVNKAIAGIAGI